MAGHAKVVCLSMSGRVLVFPLEELKLQPKGGRGLTLMDVDTKDPLVSVATCANTLKLQGTGRGGKPKEESLGATALSGHVGKRARKGKVVDGIKATRVLAG